jgi:hypothetical protein
MKNGFSLVPVLALLLAAYPCSGAGEADLGDVTAKFVRNMKLLETLMPDQEVKEMMRVVYSNAEDVAKFYRAGGAANDRRKLLKEEEELKSKPNISPRDKERLQKLQEEIQQVDPDGNYNTARGRVQQSIAELQRLMGNKTSVDRKITDLMRITRQHLEYYNASLSMYDR